MLESNSVEILRKLLQAEGKEREHYFISLGEWSENITFCNSEEEVRIVYEETLDELSLSLGVPEYCGAGLRYEESAPEPYSYFDATQSAIKIAWWQAYGGEIAIFHTGHDADSLQFVILAISDSCTLSRA